LRLCATDFINTSCVRKSDPATSPPLMELLATQAAWPGFAQCLLRALSCRLVTGLLAGMDATSAEAARTGMLSGWPVI
jgi:hypothetical protein